MSEKILDILSNHIFALIIGTLLGREITRFLYKPNVLIRFQDITPLFSDNGFFVSIRVANIGRTAATSTVGNISINDSYRALMNPDDYQSLDSFEKSLPSYKFENITLEFPRHQLVTPLKKRLVKNSNLCWATLGNPAKADINPGSNENLDICRVQYYKSEEQSFWYLIFPSEQGWRKLRCRIKLTIGEPLEGRIFICPNNVFPTVRKFSIIAKSNDELPVFSIKKYNIFQRLYFTFNRSKFYFD